MSTYLHSMQNYIREIGQLDPKKLGGDPAPPSPQSLAAAQTSLERSLREDANKTDRIILLAVVLLCLLFVAGLALVLYYRDSPQYTAAIFGGGTFFSLLGIVGWLRKLWFDKRTMDLLLDLVQSMTPGDAAKTMTSFYFGALNKQPGALSRIAAG